MMYLEESTIQNGDDEFRLGWIYTVPFVMALIIPWFAKTTFRRRAVYLAVSIATIIFTLLGTFTVMLMLFGPVGAQ